MKTVLFAVATMIAFTSTNYAGGKAVAPVMSEVAPILTEVSPNPIYIGIGGIAAFIKRDPCYCTPNGPDIKDHRYGGIFRAGFDFNPYIGIEARALRTFGNNAFSKTEHYGFYLKPQYPITDKINVYVLTGYGKTTVDYTNGLRNCLVKKNGFSYGVGMEYDLSLDENLGKYSRAFDGQGDQEKGWGLWIDFQHLLNNEGITHTDSNVVTVGVTYDF